MEITINQFSFYHDTCNINIEKTHFGYLMSFRVNNTEVTDSRFTWSC